MAPPAVPAAGRLTAILAAAVAAAIVLLYRDTAASMVAIWQRSATFNHGFVVVPIALWLIWRRRHELARVPARPFWPALAVLACAGFGWLLGNLAGAAVVEQLGLVLMIEGAMLAMLGWQRARVIAFALAFLIFAVPFGEALVPTLIDWTADFTVLALKLTGVPVYREGSFFVIPSGQWSVVEACSGLRYLIASLMVGSLYAHLTYASRWRQAAFIAASVLVPIVANWVRAYLIVMIGHLSGNELAVGVDHLIYGWIFFGFVMLLMFWIGGRFREERAQRHAVGDAARATDAAGGTIGAAALATLLLAGVWPWIGAATAASDGGPRAIAPIEPINGWRPVAPSFEWQPAFKGHRATSRQAFEREGQRVTVYIAYYAGTGEGSGLITSSNQLVPQGDAQWRETGRTSVLVDSSDLTVRMRAASLSGTAGRFDVLWTYWIDGRFTSSDSLGKALLAMNRLRGRGDDSAAVFLFTEPSERGDGAALLARFAADMAQPIARSLANARGQVSR